MGKSTPKYEKVKTKSYTETPKTPLHLTAKTIDSTSISLKWDEQGPVSGNRFFQFRLKTSRNKGRKADIVNATNTERTGKTHKFILTDLTPFISYDISVRQVLQEETSAWSMSVKAKTTGSSPQSPPQNLR
jgi:hypothetical protein